jgi:hypothetical protein
MTGTPIKGLLGLDPGCGRSVAAESWPWVKLIIPASIASPGQFRDPRASRGVKRPGTRIKLWTTIANVKA